MRWEIAGKLEEKSALLNKLLAIREIAEEDRASFLNPEKSENLITHLGEEVNVSLKLANQLITDAIDKNIPIVVHGDYDADGICATTLLTYTLKNVLHYENVFPFIPNRFKNSYGITTSSVDDCLQRASANNNGAFNGLLISVDTGITAVEAVNYAKNLGFKVLITDHHQKPEKLPLADCILWTDHLVGSGVSWILCTHLGLTEERMKSLVALATVTDLQPVMGINRSLVKEGLQEINSNPLMGIKALLEISGRTDRDVTTYDLGWVLGPRLNATGRIGDANVVLDLLLSDDYSKALDLAKVINTANVDRQDKTELMYSAIGLIDKTNLPKVILTANDEYHEGIIGLIAAKLVQEYYRPSIVISLNNGIGKGSVRSVKGVDIISFLRKFEELFESLGGHPMAAGFSIKEENIPKLQELINEEASHAIANDLLVPFLDIDLEVPLNFVDLEFVKSVETMKPFGIGNKAPAFVSRSVGIVGINTVGKTKNHLALKFSKDNKYYRGILFNQANAFANLKVGDLVDIAYSAEENLYNGTVYINLVLKDIVLTS